MTLGGEMSILDPLADRDRDRRGIVAQVPAGESSEFVKQAAQHAVRIRRAVSNHGGKKAIVAEFEAL